jgi:hypothetical protein
LFVAIAVSTLLGPDQVLLDEHIEIPRHLWIDYGLSGTLGWHAYDRVGDVPLLEGGFQQLELGPVASASAVHYSNVRR